MSIKRFFHRILKNKFSDGISSDSECVNGICKAQVLRSELKRAEFFEINQIPS